MTVDWHAHWIPPVLADALRRRRAAPRIETRDGGERLVTFSGSRTFGTDLSDLGTRIDVMRRCGITTQVLSLATLHGVHCLPLDESLPLVRTFNDAAANAVRAQPLHFAAVAALPLADVTLACRELERAHGIELRGAILPADGFVTRRTAERFLPLFETGAHLRSHFFIHPGPLVLQPERDVREADMDNAWQRYIALDTQARLSQAMATLELTDYLDPFRNVTVQVANLGGTIPFLLERMDEVCRVESTGAALPSTRLRRCYVDTASFGPRAIELAAACFGADRLLLGTDCPVFDAGRMLSSVAAVRLDSQARELLLSGNARNLLGHEAVRSRSMS